MQTYYGFPDPPLTSPSFLTIGVFDGVHRGHQALVAEMVRAAHDEGCTAGLVTLVPHPLTVLRPETPVAYLTTPEERAALLEALGLDFFIVEPFSQATAATPAVEFMRSLTDSVPIRELWIGPGFALGRGRDGDAARLRKIGDELGFTVRIVLPVDWHGNSVRSSRARTLLAQEGAVDQAALLLGRAYEVRGLAQSDPARSRLLGLPVADLTVSPGRLVPATGLYACWVWLAERGRRAIAGVPRDSGSASISLCLLDPEGDEDEFPGIEQADRMLGLSFVKRLQSIDNGSLRTLRAGTLRSEAAAARGVLGDPTDHAEWGASQDWSELRHTADRAIRVQGGSVRQLYARAASLMYRLQGADSSQSIVLARAVNVNATDPADLLVAWLNRLLFGQEVGGEMYTRFEIDEISAVGLRGIAYGYHGAPSHSAVKAATYYDLEVTLEMDLWRATVTFDV